MVYPHSADSIFSTKLVGHTANVFFYIATADARYPFFIALFDFLT
jgi:hypothetical protein